MSKQDLVSPTASGYTLVEILMAMAILALIFSIGFVSYREFSRRQELAGVARSVRGDLKLAQGLAFASSKPAAGCSVLNGYRFDSEIIVVALGFYTQYSIFPDCSPAYGGPSTKTVILPARYYLSPVPGAGQSILFKTLGQGTNIGGGTSVEIRVFQEGTGSWATTNFVPVSISAEGTVL